MAPFCQVFGSFAAHHAAADHQNLLSHGRLAFQHILSGDVAAGIQAGDGQDEGVGAGGQDDGIGMQGS